MSVNTLIQDGKHCMGLGVNQRERLVIEQVHWRQNSNMRAR